MFKTRLLSGIVLVALAILFVILGNDVLLLVVSAISLIGMFELYRVIDLQKKAPAILSYLAAILFFLNLRFEFIPDILMLVFGYLILLLFFYVFAYPKYDARMITMLFFGLFYVAGMLSYVYQIRMLNNGLYLTFLVFICSWGCDTSAYCVGKLIGKHKMSPILSPKKSVEGAVGGVLGAAGLAALYGFIFKSQMQITGDQIGMLALITGIAALISMVGDLAASAIKRNYDIKDYGKLIPGHGGIMDRFDSMIITAPIIYYLAYYLM